MPIGVELCPHCHRVLEAGLLEGRGYPLGPSESKRCPHCGGKIAITQEWKDMGFSAKARVVLLTVPFGTVFGVIGSMSGLWLASELGGGKELTAAMVAVGFLAGVVFAVVRTVQLVRRSKERSSKEPPSKRRSGGSTSCPHCRRILDVDGMMNGCAKTTEDLDECPRCGRSLASAS